MTKSSIFYAWQSDRSESICRYLIRDAAKAAIKALARDAEVEDSPRLDSDTQGEAGHPEIARTIFGKIDEAAVFLADLTFTGEATTSDDRKKLLPNANVLLELGHASARMGWDRMVLVMNTSFGKPDQQLFDILHRRHPISYELPSDERELKSAAIKSLGDSLFKAFKATFAAEHDRVATLVRRLDANCVGLMHIYGGGEYFSGPKANEFVLGSSTGLDTPAFNAAITRLLDL